MAALADLPRTSLVLACDMPPQDLTRVVKETATVPEVAAYKIGAALALELGLGIVAREIRNIASDALIIYDHQKASTDIPDTGVAFMEALKRCDVDAVILFPLSGPATETAWIAAAQGEGLDVIVGCHMTHAEFLVSDGGYIEDEAVGRAYELARDRGVRDFVVPVTIRKRSERFELASKPGKRATIKMVYSAISLQDSLRRVVSSRKPRTRPVPTGTQSSVVVYTRRRSPATAARQLASKLRQ